MLQKQLLQQLVTSSKAYGTLLGSGGVGDPGVHSFGLGHSRLICQLSAVVAVPNFVQQLPVLVMGKHSSALQAQGGHLLVRIVLLPLGAVTSCKLDRRGVSLLNMG